MTKSAAPKIICDATRGYRLSETADLHDVTGHHRYYGSSASNGERPSNRSSIASSAAN